MGRPSNREEKRGELLAAFAKVLANHGYAGATVANVALEAGVSPGLLHHHFKSKEELLDCLLGELMRRFRRRHEETRSREPEAAPIDAYVDSALKLDTSSDTTAARCWVGLFAEAVRNPVLFRKVRRMFDDEVGTIRSLSGQRLDEHQASAVLAFIVGSLVFGAFAPRRAAGFAAPVLHEIIEMMLRPHTP